MNRGGFLASIHTSYQDAYLFSQTNRIIGDAWIGFHDLDAFDAWIWSDNTVVSYTNWAQGEPNHGGSYGPDEDCAILRRFSEGQWNDINCDAEREFICSKIKSADNPPKGENTGCPLGFTKFTNSDGSSNCWLYDATKKPYSQARLPFSH